LKLPVDVGKLKFIPAALQFTLKVVDAFGASAAPRDP